eukprot:jgi/Botrbrau1/15071/Bobra.0286s0004.2
MMHREGMANFPSWEKRVSAAWQPVCLSWGTARTKTILSCSANAPNVADNVVQVDWTSIARSIQKIHQAHEMNQTSKKAADIQKQQGMGRRIEVLEVVNEEELNAVFDQLPDWFDDRHFDWSGKTNYTAINRELRSTLPRVVSREAGTCKKIYLGGRLGWMNMVTLWISIHQTNEFERARIYQSTSPMNDDFFTALSSPLEPFASADSMTFNNWDERNGPWRNFLVGVVGSMSAMEEDILWPNQVIHGDRTMHNLRGPQDLARFLADPTKADIEAHLINLRVLQEERRYREGWCHLMLKSRWGAKALRDFNILLDRH